MGPPELQWATAAAAVGPGAGRREALQKIFKYTEKTETTETTQNQGLTGNACVKFVISPKHEKSPTVQTHLLV